MGKALWFIAAARKFSLFWDWVERANFVDKLIVQNYLHHEAHNIALKYFMEHPEYDYFIISSDDVLGSPDYVRLLLEDEETHKFPVVSGWSNVLLDKPWSALSLAPANPQGIRTKAVSFDTYGFIHMSDIILANVPGQQGIREKYGWPFIKVWFIGLALTLIQRETLKTVPFRPFRTAIDHLSRLFPATHGKGRGIMFDLQFSLDCQQKNIPIIVDTRLFLLHFGFMGKYVRVGKDPPSVNFVKAEAPL